MSPNNKKGFSLIEIIVVVSIFIIVSLVAFSFLSIVLVQNSKISLVKEVRQNGNYALMVLERLISSAKEIDCPDNQSVSITDINDSSTVIACTEGRVASSSAYLTSSEVSVSGCLFTCLVSEGLPSSLEVQFTISQLGVAGRSSESESQTFRTKLVLRNKGE